MFGVQSIQLGLNNIVVAGGMENMSQVPYFIPKARTGLRMGVITFFSKFLANFLRIFNIIHYFFVRMRKLLML